MSSSPSTFRGLGESLKTLRGSTTEWRVCLIDGPNMNNVGPGGRDQRTYGAIRSLSDLHQYVTDFAVGFGVACEPFTSNHEGAIVEYIYDRIDHADLFLVNPAGMNLPGQSFAQALRDSRVPYLELHFANVGALGWAHGTVVTDRATGVAMGLREYSYIAGLFGAVLCLDNDEVTTHA